MYNTIKCVLNYYFLIHCNLFIILIGSNGANEKEYTGEGRFKRNNFNFGQLRVFY